MKDNMVLGMLWFTVVMFILGILFAPPYFEMRAFNKFSKTKVTYWDAMWLNLRIFADKE